jgi:hypothetical protein
MANWKIREWVNLARVLEINPGCQLGPGVLDALQKQPLAEAGHSMFKDTFPIVLLTSMTLGVSIWCKKCWLDETTEPVPMPKPIFFTNNISYTYGSSTAGSGYSSSTTGGYYSWR